MGNAGHDAVDHKMQVTEGGGGRQFIAFWVGYGWRSSVDARMPKMVACAFDLQHDRLTFVTRREKTVCEGVSRSPLV